MNIPSSVEFEFILTRKTIAPVRTTKTRAAIGHRERRTTGLTASIPSPARPISAFPSPVSASNDGVKTAVRSPAPLLPLLPCSIGVFCRRNKAIALPGNRLHETRLFRIIAENLTDFSDGSVNAVLGIEEDILAPDLFDDLVAADQPAVALREESEELHGDFFKLENTVGSAQLITAAVKFEFREFHYADGHAQGSGGGNYYTIISSTRVLSAT